MLPTRKVFNMTGGDDDYGDAFKEAKLEHDQRRQGSKEEQRLQAEADAAAAALSEVVLPQLQAAAEKLEPLGGRVEIRRYGRTGKSLRPTSVAFRVNGHWVPAREREHAEFVARYERERARRHRVVASACLAG
jgi:hypothetical protein